MAEQSEISWTDGTFNPWIGCTKVSPACERCYAARDNARRHWVESWGDETQPVSPRRRTSPANWRNPIKWNRTALETYGRRMRVFCSSLADVFDNQVEQAWRDDLFALIRQTPNINWILLSKRIGNAPKMLPADWGAGYDNVGLMATLENQEVWDRDFAKLMRIPARWHGVSVEPMLGPININRGVPGTDFDAKRVDWIITGGESGPGFRDLDMDAVRYMRDQCLLNDITFHHKQNGGLTGKVNGCLVDGAEHKHFPPALAA